jgi:hypothetical protein
VTIPSAVFGDFVAFNANNNTYLFTSLGATTPAVIITDPTGKVVRTIPTDAGAHAVAVQGQNTILIPQGMPPNFNAGGLVVYPGDD